MNAEDLMLAVAAALDRARIPGMLVGAFSASYHGIPRSTEDADFVLQISDLQITLLAGLLGPEFKIDPQARIETFTMGVYYHVSHRDSDFTIDLFLIKDDPHDRAAFARRITVSYGGRGVFLSTAEDLVITKLRWSQSGRRSKDIDDARNVLAVQQGQLDMPYMRGWCARHGTLELLDAVLESIPRLPPA